MHTLTLRTLLTLPLLLALTSPVLAEDDKALLAQCDINKNGAIDTAEMYGFTTRAAYRTADPKIKEAVSKEWNCKMDYELAKGKEDLAKGKEDLAKSQASIAKGKEDLAKGKEDLAKGKEDLRIAKEKNEKMLQILAMLDKSEARKYLQNQIKDLELQLQNEKNQSKKKGIINLINYFKEKLSNLEKNG